MPCISSSCRRQRLRDCSYVARLPRAAWNFLALMLPCQIQPDQSRRGLQNGQGRSDPKPGRGLATGVASSAASRTSRAIELVTNAVLPGLAMGSKQVTWRIWWRRSSVASGRRKSSRLAGRLSVIAMGVGFTIPHGTVCDICKISWILRGVCRAGAPAEAEGAEAAVSVGVACVHLRRCAAGLAVVDDGSARSGASTFGGSAANAPGQVRSGLAVNCGALGHWRSGRLRVP